MKTNNILLSSQSVPSSLDYFTVLKTLGQGSSAKVKLVEDQHTGSMYAAKLLLMNPKISPFYYRSKIATEVKCLSHLAPHPNIISLSNYEKSGSYTSKSKGYQRCMYTLLEYCPHGDLFKLLKNNGPLPKSLTNYFFHQITEALEHCHQRGIAHGDLKPENLLIDKNFEIKLTDFELAHFDKNSKYLGTEGYLPPEARAKKVVNSEKADFFVLGLILFIMYVGSPPFVKSSDDDALYSLFKNSKEDYWAFMEKRRPNIDFTEEFREIVEGLLSHDPAKRWACQEIKSSKWYTQEAFSEEGLAYLKSILCQ